MPLWHKVIAAVCAASCAFCAIHVARFLPLECDCADDQRPNANDKDEERHAEQDSGHSNEERILVTITLSTATKFFSFLQVTPWE